MRTHRFRFDKQGTWSCKECGANEGSTIGVCDGPREPTVVFGFRREEEDEPDAGPHGSLGE